MTQENTDGRETIFLKSPRDKALHCATQFGANAKITRIYTRIAELMGDESDIEKLEEVVTQVEQEFGIDT